MSNTSVPNDLQTLINAIPTAEEGRVITPNYHNTARAALVRLASLAGGPPATSKATLVYFPTFFRVGRKEPVWETGLGHSTRPETNSAAGWFPVVLPDGSQVESMSVIGQKTGPVEGFELKMFLFSVSLVALQRHALMWIALEDATGGLFTREGVSYSGTVTVDNSQNQYFVLASMSNAPEDLVIRLYAVRFVCRLG